MKHKLVLLLFILLLSSIYAQTKPVKAPRDSSISSAADSAAVLNPSKKPKHKPGIKDSLTAADSMKAHVVRDTLNPIFQNGLLDEDEYGTTFTREKFTKYDYRFAGDLFSYLPAGYNMDLGQMGQPTEVTMFGLGFGNISYLVDGIPQNNRLRNSFDLNNFQSVYIDSLEVVPLPRGFLYGGLNNEVSVNFVTHDKIVTVPTSVIRFFQATNNEGYIGVGFNAYLMNKLNGSFEITNNSVDSRFQNSEYGGWKTAVRLRYLLSNKVNIVGSYSYVKTQTNLFGGVNIDSTEKIYQPSEVQQALFDPQVAPVEYGFANGLPSRYQKSTQHNFYLKILGRFIKDSPTDLTFYYQFNNTEFRQNERKFLNNIPVIFNNNKYKAAGGTLRQTLTSGIFKFELLLNYELVDYKAHILKSNTSKTNYSAAGRGQAFLFNKAITASVFAKQLIYGGAGFPGFGADIDFNFNGSLKFYGGASYYEKPLSILQEQFLRSNFNMDRQKINTYEIGVKFNFPFLFGSANLFDTNIKGLMPVIDNYSDSLKINEVGFYDSFESNARGINLNLNTRVSKILFSLNFNYNFSSAHKNRYAVPEFNMFGGVYYVDRLFNDNLNLKTGLNFRALGRRDAFVYDYEKSTAAFYRFNSASGKLSLISDQTLSTKYQFDFFFAGTIQEVAIIYFVFENLLDENYFPTAYYPKQGRGLRLGLTWQLFD